MNRREALALTAALIFVGCNNPAPLTIATAALPPAKAGEPYRFKLTAQGGTPPYIWSIENV